MGVDLGEMIKDSRRISILLQACGTKVLAGYDLTDVQARVLLYVLEHADKGASLTKMHRELNFSMASASGIIKRLREKGYVRVEGCLLDERKKLIFATEKGSAVREVMNSSLRSLPELLYRGFTADELRALDRLQKRMLENLSLSERESINLEVDTH